MNRIESVASFLVDAAIVEHALPRPCPCDFGPDDRYRLEEAIGSGRDSFVYRATDKKLSSGGFPSKVAIKIHESGASTLAEAISARRVHHRNVVQVLDSGVAEGSTSYLVTELMPDGDLSGVSVPLPPRQAADLISQIASGVQALHNAGIVHGDLKPANILLAEDGTPKIADFDLASRDTEVRYGGNYAFVSPEVIRCALTPPAPPADIYALGGLLYYLLTGQVPNGSSPAAVRARLTNPTDPPRPAIQRDIDHICRRALAYCIEDRYHSAGELESDVTDWLSSKPLPWTKPSTTRRLILWTRRRPFKATALLIALVVLAFGAAWYGRHLEYLAVEAQMELNRDRQAVAIAQQKVDESNARLRRYFEMLASSGLLSPSSRRRGYIMPAMVWLGWLTKTPLLDANGSTLLWSVRMQHLEMLVALLREQGHLDHVDARLAQFYLAALYIESGEYDNAGSTLTESLVQWQSDLATADPVYAAIDAMALIVDVAHQIEEGRITVDTGIRSVERLLSVLSTEGDRDEAVRLLELTRDQLKEHGIPPS